MNTSNSRSVNFTGCAPASGFSGSRFLLVALLVLSYCFLASGPLFGQDRNSTPDAKKEIRYVAFPGLYLLVSRKDGRMALELLMRKTAIQELYPYSVKLDFLDPVPDEEIPDAVNRGRYHFVTLSTLDYYKYRHAIPLKPLLIPSKDETGHDHLLLLVAKERSLATIGQKEERSLILEAGTNGELSKIWLDTLLADSGFAQSERFFTQITRVSKPSRAVLPVFFKQADACVVTRRALNVIQELNPQIGRQVIALHQSDGLVRHLICSTDHPTQRDIDILIRTSTNMGENPESRQAMTILQMKRFVRVDPGDLAATEALLSRHRKMMTNFKSGQ